MSHQLTFGPNQSRFIAFLCLLGVLTGAPTPSRAQNAANYGFSTHTNGTLVPMDGSRVILGGGASLTSSGIIDFGFETWFMGERYTQFSMNANGVIRFGPVQLIREANSYLIDFQARLVPFASTSVENQGAGTVYVGAWRVWARGQIHRRVIGTAPNRVMVVECRDMSIGQGSATPDASWQVLINESTFGSSEGGRIEFRYDRMTSTVADRNIQIGLGTGSQAGQHLGVRLGEPVRRELNGVNNPIPAGEVPYLHSPTEGSRRVMVFNPPSANGQVTNLRTTCSTGTRVELLWDNGASNSVGAVIYRSTDNVNFAFHTQVKRADGNRYVDENLQVGQTYYYRAYAVTEGRLSVLNPSATLTVSPGVPPASPVRRSLCGNGNLTLDAGAGYTAYRWSTGQTTPSIGITAPNTGQEQYSVEVSDACNNTVVIEFTVKAVEAVIGGQRLFCPAESPTNLLTGPPGFAAYRWTNAQGQLLGQGQNLAVRDEGTYQLEVATTEGCTTQATAEIKACCEGTVTIPSAFTPHTTAANNLFRVAHAGLSDFRMQVFNRWGIEVYQATDPDQGWDGQVNGQPAPAGAYQVVVEYVGCNLQGSRLRRKQTGVLHLVE
jgi:gliding motility-associated-like protein